MPDCRTTGPTQRRRDQQFHNAAILTFSATGGRTTFSGSIQDGNTPAGVSLVMAGSGTQVLAGNNTFSGSTTLSSGTLQLANQFALQDRTVVVNSANSLAFSTGIPQFNAGALSGSASFALSNTSGGPVTLQVGSNNTSTQYSGSIGGNGSLLKTGSGTLALDGSNAFSGSTTISAGALKAGIANTLSPNSDLVVNGGTLDATGFVQTVKSLTIGSLGSLNLTIGNPLTLHRFDQS